MDPKKALVGLAVLGVIAVLSLFTFRTTFVESYTSPSGAMIPTIEVGDHFFVNKLAYGIQLPFLGYVTDVETPERGDVVVFWFPQKSAREHILESDEPSCIDASFLEGEPARMTKRVVGVPGDTIEMRANRLFIDGESVETTVVSKKETGNHLYPYEVTERETLPNGPSYDVQYLGIGEAFGAIEVEPGHVFVMGDNRDNSSDSRCYGQVPIGHIIGRHSP